MELLFTLIGLVGVSMSLGAYALLTRRVFTNSDPLYYWINIIGTLLIGASIIVQWNLAAFVSQVVWIVISVVGLVRSKRGHA